MKLFSKVLCILSVLVLCVPFFCLSVSADSSSSGSFGNVDMTLPPYYGIETFEPNEDGSGFKIAAEDLSSDGQPLYLEKNRIDRVNQMDPYFLFTYCIDVQYRKNLISFNTNSEYYYFTYFFDKVKSYDDYSNTTRTCYTYISTTPFYFEVYDSNSYYLMGDDIYCTGAAFSIIIEDGITEYVYPSDIVDGLHRFDKNMVSNKASDSVEGSYKCYTNCNIDTSMFDSDENLVKGISDLKQESQESSSDLISVTVEPDFYSDMNTKELDDRWSFTVENNSDKPIQFCAYIDNPTSEDFVGDSCIGDCVINPAYTRAQWNYKVEADYYDIEITTEESLLGVFVDATLSPVKAHGITVWVYVPPHSSYSDVVYWQNMNVARNTEYALHFRAVFLSEGLSIATNIFDTELMKDPVTLYDLYTNSEVHWWTLELFSEVNVSQKLSSYEFSFKKDVIDIYLKNFSFKYAPDYSANLVGGKGVSSSGYINDLSEFNHKDVSYNLDTGKTSYGIGGSSNNFSYDINDASVDDVMGYLDYSKNFFGLIGATLNTFPTFIWGLIAFGLSAFVVIAIVKWIIT